MDFFFKNSRIQLLPFDSLKSNWAVGVCFRLLCSNGVVPLLMLIRSFCLDSLKRMKYLSYSCWTSWKVLELSALQSWEVLKLFPLYSVELGFSSIGVIPLGKWLLFNFLSCSPNSFFCFWLFKKFVCLCCPHSTFQKNKNCIPWTPYPLLWFHEGIPLQLILPLLLGRPTNRKKVRIWHTDNSLSSFKTCKGKSIISVS